MSERRTGDEYDARFIQWWQEGLTEQQILQRLPSGWSMAGVRHRRKMLGLYENRNASPAQRAKEAQKYKEKRRLKDQARLRTRAS